MTDMQTHPLRTSDSAEEITLAHTGLKAKDEQRLHKIAWAGQAQDGASSAPDQKGDGGSSSADSSEDKDKGKPRGERLMAGLVRGMHSLGTAVHDVGHSVKEQTRAMGDLLKLSKLVSEDLKNTTLYPELLHDAHLRRNNNLSPEEEAFVTARKAYIAKSGILKRFLQLPEDEVVHEEDVPQIALGGSGGGYRACLGFLSAIEQMQEPDTGLWDLIMYVAGVSGSCWSIASLYTFSHLRAADMMHHFAHSSGSHPLSAKAINAVAHSSQGVYFQLAPLVLKLKVGHVKPTPLDLYGTLTTTHIFLSPAVRAIAKAEKEAAAHQAKEEQRLDHPGDEEDEEEESIEYTGQLQKEWFKFSRTAETCGIMQGKAPLPILTAIRHERPWKDWKSPEDPFEDADDHIKSDKLKTAWWQWFEITSLEMGCDELEGWLPTWAFGRRFEEGVSKERLPELSLSLILGLCTAAPAGPLAAYLSTIYRNLPSNAIGNKIREWSDNWTKKHKKSAEKLQNHHPIHAQNEPNPFFKSQKDAGRGHGFENSPRIHLVDSGMSNNLPLAPAFRPGRSVDVLLLGDYSSDVQKGAAVQRIDEGLRERGLKVKPRTSLPALEPLLMQGEGKNAKPKVLSAEEVETRFKGRYAQILDTQLLSKEEIGQVTIDADADTRDIMNERNVPQARRPVTLVYLPLLPNKCQPAYDPSTAEFSSSYNLAWTDEQVETIRRTSKANTVDALANIRTVVREAYERRKAERLGKSNGSA